MCNCVAWLHADARRQISDVKIACIVRRSCMKYSFVDCDNERVAQ